MGVQSNRELRMCSKKIKITFVEGQEKYIYRDTGKSCALKPNQYGFTKDNKDLRTAQSKRSELWSTC